MEIQTGGHFAGREEGSGKEKEPLEMILIDFGFKSYEQRMECHSQKYVYRDAFCSQTKLLSTTMLFNTIKWMYFEKLNTNY
jgi:hypothetical protein